MGTSLVSLMTLGKGLPSGAGRTPPTVRLATENKGRQGEGWTRRSSPRVLFNGNENPGGCDEGRVEGNRSQECGFAPRRRTHRALGLALNIGRRLGDWSKAQFAQGVIPGKAATRGNRRGERRGTQSGRWLCRKPPHQWKLRCNSKRPAWHRCPTGACQSSGAATFVEQQRRSHVEAAGEREPFQPQWGERAAIWPLRCGKGVQGCLAGSSRCLLSRGSAGTGLRCGMGSRNAVLGLVATSVYQSVG